MVKQSIKRQREFFDSNKTKDIRFRLEMLKKLHLSIKTNEKEIVNALKLDLGKSEYEAYATEVGFVLKSLSETIKHLRKWTKDIKVKTPIYHGISKSYIRYEPYGSVLIIGPYNYPFQLLMEPFIGAIASGNTCVLKPSEMAVNTEKIIVKIIEDIFEDNYVSVFTGGVDITQELIHSHFDYIFFTGSEFVGKIVYEAAAKNLTPVTLELGGKSPVIFDKNVNIDISVKRLVWGKFLNAGQTCIAPDYLLVHTDVKDEVLEKIKYYINDFYGDNPKTNLDYGKIINERHFNRLSRLINSNKVYDGGNVDYRDNYIQPTIMVDVDYTDDVMKEEIFGPILPVIEYNDLDKIISDIKSKPKPLALYVFTEDKKVQNKIMNEISFGGGCINDTITHVANPHLPFGGVGSSGISSYHGKYSIETFSHKKSIVKKSTKFDLKLIYPPYNNKVNLVKRVFK